MNGDIHSTSSIFEKLIRKTVIPENMPIEHQAELMEPLKVIIQGSLPDRLYRYRSCNEKTIEAFYGDKIYYSNGKYMNDGFDARVFLNKDVVSNWYLEQTSEKRVKELIEYLKNNDEVPEEMREIPNIDEIFAIAKLMPQDYINSAVTGISTSKREMIDELMHKIMEIAQESVEFVCLSEVLNSPMMWGHYAQNEEGFCLEYDFKQSGQETKKATLFKPVIFPIVYGKDRFKVTDEYVQYLLTYRDLTMVKPRAVQDGYGDAIDYVVKERVICPDVFMATKIAIHKSLEWEHEREWRMFNNSHAENIYERRYYEKRPVAIYLGRRMSPINKHIMKSLAREKGIPVYQMLLNDESPS